MLKQAYYYLVLFATLMMAIGGSVSIFMAAADVFFPHPYYQTFEEYKQTYQYKYDYQTGTETRITLSEIEEEKIKDAYEVEVNSYYEHQKTNAKNRIVKSLGWIFIPLPVFLYFQSQLKGRRNEEETNDTTSLEKTDEPSDEKKEEQ